MKKWKELPYDLAVQLSLPTELSAWTGRLTVTGGKTALIEDHRGIIEYSDTRIVVSAGRGKIIISGTGLKLTAMNRGELLVNGRIQSAEWV